MLLDRWAAALLAPLACWVILNGVDDLFIDLAALYAWVLRKFSSRPEDRAPEEAELSAVPERRIAIFVALWREHRVIRKMIETNLANLNYSNFDLFVGTYPNDAPTIAAVQEAMKLHANVHQGSCPHDGPTSKADCLNWIYQRMLLYEEQNAVRFETVVIHDAEDIIDPDALRWINYHARSADMVQMPVLALKTPVGEILHGVYCDEFAEFQQKDMQARQLLGGFIPCSGVGAGFSRRALEMLAERNHNRIFEPRCLTEDYEIGFRIHALGLRQKFVPILIRHGRALATREYFPHTFRNAVRQRCRWVMGIALQSWEFHTAQETLRYLYWFWRDRKALLGNVAAPVANILFLYGLATWCAAAIGHYPWGLARESAFAVRLSYAGFALQVLHTSIRAWCCANVYGWKFAAATPARVIAANWLNCFATLRAIRTFLACKLSGEPVRWAKTDHLYPSRAALMPDLRSLEDVLLSSRAITPTQLDLARANRPDGVDLGVHLMALGLLSEKELCEAIARRKGIPFGAPRFHDISLPITRIIPARVCRRRRLLAFRVICGELHIVTADPPGEDAESEIRQFTSLEFRFQLVTPRDFADLASRYLPDAA